MQFPPPVLPLALAAFLLPLCAAASAEPLELRIVPTGSAASERPLPVGASPGLAVTVRNAGTKAAGPVELTVRFDGLAAGEAEGWRLEDGALKAAIGTIEAGVSLSRALRLRVEKAPLEASSARVSVEAKGPDGGTAASETEFRIADCAGAYRARLESLRASLAQPVRDAAEEMRRSDPALPAARQFPATGARSGDLARAERLAAGFAVRRGADPQLSTEWFRFLLARWASELNAYAGQAANPGLCANNYYQIAGYRQGLLPLTRHIDATRAAAQGALEAARKEAATESASLAEIARALAQQAQAESADENADALSVLAAVRGIFTGARRPAPDLARKLSLAETAAWLAETDRRGERLVRAIEQTLATIAAAHKETCVCAF